VVVGAVEAGRADSALRARTVTLLVADLEDAARLRDAVPDAMAEAAAGLRRIVSEAAAARGGSPRSGSLPGDAVAVAFQRPGDAVRTAVEVQQAVRGRSWPDGIEPRARTAVHAHGLEREVDVGVARCARLVAVARGGQTLLSQAARDLVVDRLPAGARLADLGVRRLPDLAAPEHVHALIGRGDGPPAAPRSLDELPNNLPHDLTTFVGRERELADVRAVLETTRLLTLTGAGGCGKTRLALQAAADAVDRFPGGVWWVELGPLAAPAGIGEALAGTLGVRQLPGQSALDAAVLQLAGRRALVLLDNCEHLVEGAAEAAETLLRGCPEVTVLVTSRALLDLPAETMWRVPSMALPAPGAAGGVGEVAASDAVRLFVERAAKVRPDFAVTSDNAPAVAELCSKLDGIPLAIELAAARVQLLSVEQIVAALSDRFHLLTVNNPTALPRHRTLRASVDWSHELLSGPERALLRRLGVFSGGFTLEALERIWSPEEEGPAALDLLGALVDRSLVVVDQDGPRVRYRLPDTMREYALERLAETGELEAVRDRHRDCFLELAESAEPEMVASEAGFREALDADAGNLAAALEWAIRTDGERALRLCRALVYWWRLRGMLALADTACDRALRAADPAPTPLRARVMWGRAYLQTFVARFDDATETLDEARDVAERAGDVSTSARSLFLVGRIRQHSDALLARPALARARELARECGDDWCYAAATSIFAWSHVFADEYDEAERLFAEMLPIAEREGFRETVAWTYVGRSYRHMTGADAERLFELAELAVEVAREVGEPVTEGLAHSFMGRMELAQGRSEAALERLEASLERVVAAGAGMALSATEVSLAAVRADLGDLRGAIAGLEPLVASGLDSGWQLCRVLVQLAELKRVEGDRAGAHDLADRALAIGERIRSPLFASWSTETLGRVAAARGDWKRAESLLHASLATRVEHGLRLWLPQTLDALAEVAAGFADHAKAVRLLGAAARARADLGLVRWSPDRPLVEELERRLRAALADDDHETAVREGERLSLGQAIEYVQRGRGSRKRPPDGWESLTPTERVVVRHAAAGRQNREIAEAMFVAPGTVKTHLSHVYAKLGVRNRAELTAVVRRNAGTGTADGR
jgi:predicted ATPase/DNA-binding CsgD family transcriptional regulator/class 3 adenylate cyclase